MTGWDLERGRMKRTGMTRAVHNPHLKKQMHRHITVNRAHKQGAAQSRLTQTEHCSIQEITVPKIGTILQLRSSGSPKTHKLKTAVHGSAGGRW